MKDIYHKIKTLAKEQGITIEALEDQCGLGRNTMNRWTETMPSADKLARVAQVLGTTVEELLQAREEANHGEHGQETL